MLQSLRAVSLESIKLEKRVEIHKLDSGTAIDVFCRHLLKEFLLCTDGVLITIAMRKTEKLAVRSEECKVTSPSIDTDRLQLNAFLSSFLQSFQYFIVQARKVPIKVTAHWNHRIFEACKLLHLDFLAIISCKNCSSAGCSQVNC